MERLSVLFFTFLLTRSREANSAVVFLKEVLSSILSVDVTSLISVYIYNRGEKKVAYTDDFDIGSESLGSTANNTIHKTAMRELISLVEVIKPDVIPKWTELILFLSKTEITFVQLCFALLYFQSKIFYIRILKHIETVNLVYYTYNGKLRKQPVQFRIHRSCGSCDICFIALNVIPTVYRWHTENIDHRIIFNKQGRIHSMKQRNIYSQN